MLHRTARQKDLVLGVADGDAVVPLRIDVSDGPGFSALAQRAATALENARPHASVGVGAICERLGCEELFQVVYLGRGAATVDGVDLALAITADGGTTAALTYNALLFDEDTVGRMLGHFDTLLAGAIANPETPLGELPFLTPAELDVILVEWNDKKVDFPADKTLHDLFEERAAATPDAVAAVFRGQAMSYRQLNERANQVAHHLRSLGVETESLVGISTERSFELVIGLLGIAKAGGAYVPMDPAYPRQRLTLMMEDSGTKVLLTQKHLADSIPETQASVVFLDDAARFSRESTDNPNCGVGPDNLAYVIYTSGSTGAPKGVVLNHQGRVNNFLDFNRRFSVGDRDRLIALASLSFDMCAYDVFGTLAAGAGIVLPEPEHMQDPVQWARLMNEQKVTIWHTAPAMLKMLVDHLEAQPDATPQSLRLVLLGGDWIPVNLPDRLRALVDDVQVISMGGATECSMDSTIYEVLEVDPGWNSIPYGEPMANQTAYVLDPDLQPTPIGVPGELFLGGIGVGRGYHNRPELTDERFLPCPVRRRRAHVSHRRPGALDARRQPRVARPHGQPGQDPRLPHRAGRDRGAAARSRGGPGRRRGRPRRRRRREAAGRLRGAGSGVAGLREREGRPGLRAGRAVAGGLRPRLRRHCRRRRRRPDLQHHLVGLELHQPSHPRRADAPVGRPDRRAHRGARAGQRARDRLRHGAAAVPHRPRLLALHRHRLLEGRPRLRQPAAAAVEARRRRAAPAVGRRLHRHRRQQPRRDRAELDRARLPEHGLPDGSPRWLVQGGARGRQGLRRRRAKPAPDRGLPELGAAVPGERRHHDRAVAQQDAALDPAGKRSWSSTRRSSPG